MEHIAFIPAKGNSEAVAEKNLQKIGDFTLVEWSLSYALESEIFNNIVVSTESTKVIKNTRHISEHSEEFENLEEGKNIFLKNGITIHKRRTIDASRLSKTSDFISGYLNDYKLNLNGSLTLLQPTSPFRALTEVREILKFIELGKVRSIASAKLFDSPHPEKAFEVGGDSRISAGWASIERLGSPRQNLKRYHVADGAFYSIIISEFIKNPNFIQADTLIFEREGLKTINIDNEQDLEFARYIFSQQNSNLPWKPTIADVKVSQ
jgi:CMP-N-acetylneuraminic acid synthetase